MIPKPSGLCRDCAARWDGEAPRCGECGSLRLVHHAELHDLAIAHLDCDAFYASVEKRDDPSLKDQPVIVGGGKRGVVAACCYIARTYGIRSAMPMFKALRACPDAVVIRPNMKKYVAIGGEIRDLMRETTPLVEPLSIDEAFLDLTGTGRLHGGSPAQTLALLCLRVESETGLTASIGLSYNKFLAKVASDMDKPRGFMVIGQDNVLSFLKDQPVNLIWGVGPSLQKRLTQDGVCTLGQLQQMDETVLVARYGSMGRRLARFSRGEDARSVNPSRPAKSISSETTFNEDIADITRLKQILWRQSERVSGRLKTADRAGTTITLKLKTADFRILSRSRSLSAPSQLAEVIYRNAESLLEAETAGGPFRLLGVGISGLAEGDLADPPDLLDPGAEHRAAVERAIDAVRDKLGEDAVVKGRGFRGRTTDR